MLGACLHGTDLPPATYSPRIQAAWDHYCTVSAGSVAGGVDHWGQVPGWAKVDCLRATDGLPPAEEVEITVSRSGSSPVQVTVRHLRTGLRAEATDLSQLRARDAALCRLADLLAGR